MAFLEALADWNRGRPKMAGDRLNVLVSNQEKQKVVDYLLKEDPDFIFLYETNGEWISFLRNSPLRTLDKIRMTLAEIASIFLRLSIRVKFRKFLSICVGSGSKHNSINNGE